MAALDVEGILAGIGVEIIRESGEELLGKCPMHLARTGKEDRHPSWSINSRTYAHHCFSCGYSGSLVTLYRDLVGEPPEDLEWELSKQSLLASLDKPVPVEETGPAVNEWVLDNYAELPDRLMERRMLTRQAVTDHQIKWDTKNKTWVIPVRTPGGDLMGFQFRQKGIVLNHPAGMEKSTTLFGLHLHKDDTRSTITVVESPLDAVRLYGLGIAAVSTFGAGVSNVQMSLLSKYFNTIVLAMDNDPAGHTATSMMEHVLRKSGCATLRFSYKGLDGKDPGDIKCDTTLREAWYNSLSMNLLRSTD